MFSRKEDLDKRTGEYGIGRLPYLQSLVTEFQETSSQEAKQQIVANLANFAYDPINYDHLKILNVVDLFLDCLTETDAKLVRFAIGGLCNIIQDEDVKSVLSKGDGFHLIADCLKKSDEETLIATLTILNFLLTSPSCIDQRMLQNVSNGIRELSSSDNKRITNLISLLMKQLGID